MQRRENISKGEDLQAGLIALCEGMDTCFAYIGHYQTGQISYISRSVHTIIGYPQDYFLNSGIDALRSTVHPEDMPNIMLIVSEVIKEYHINIATGNINHSPKVATYYFRAKHSNGEWIPVDQKVFVLTVDKNGMPDLIFSIIMPDFTARGQGLYNEVLNGEREKLLSRLEFVRVHSNNLLKLSNCNEPISFKHPIEITTHSNPLREVSVREKEVLTLISEGLATKEIAKKLGISFHTVESHRKNLLEKFHAKNSAALIKAALKYYWLE